MDRIWTKPFIQMTVGMLILFIGFYLLLPTMPLFIKEIGGSEADVGLAAGVFRYRNGIDYAGMGLSTYGIRNVVCSMCSVGFHLCSGFSHD